MTTSKSTAKSAKSAKTMAGHQVHLAPKPWLTFSQKWKNRRKKACPSCQGQKRANFTQHSLTGKFVAFFHEPLGRREKQFREEIGNSKDAQNQQRMVHCGVTSNHKNPEAQETSKTTNVHTNCSSSIQRRADLADWRSFMDPRSHD